MKTIRIPIPRSVAALTVLFLLVAGSCKKEKDVITPRQTTYDLKVKDVSGISGTVTFTETSPTQTTVEIVLNGISSGVHPAHIHLGAAVESGAIAISLNPVDATGKSVTVVTQKDDNTPITYSELIVFDGYVNVHQSLTSLGVIIAQGDIGGNALTTTSETYALTAVAGSGVSGTAMIQKRNNGNILLTVTLTGIFTGDVYPSHIHSGSVATVGGGPVVISLTSINGATGTTAVAYTNIRKFDNLEPITFDNLLLYQGYLNVHTSLGTVICHGNIGSNV